jgi:hypothetical protein
MALLTAVQKKAAWHRFIEDASRTGPAGWNKVDLDAAVTAANQWCDDNQASYVSALVTGAPTFGGANSTATQKTLLLIYVLMVRQGLI